MYRAVIGASEMIDSATGTTRAVPAAVRAEICAPSQILEGLAHQPLARRARRSLDCRTCVAKLRSLHRLQQLLQSVQRSQFCDTGPAIE